MLDLHYLPLIFNYQACCPTGTLLHMDLTSISRCDSEVVVSCKKNFSFPLRVYEYLPKGVDICMSSTNFLVLDLHYLLLIHKPCQFFLCTTRDGVIKLCSTGIWITRQVFLKITFTEGSGRFGLALHNSMLEFSLTICHSC